MSIDEEERKKRNREAQKRYCEGHKEEIREYQKRYQKRYRGEHQETIRERQRGYQKRYREGHKEEIREAKRKYYKENPDTVKKWIAKYRAKNPAYTEKWLKNLRKWCEDNPEKVWAKGHRRRARLRGVESDDWVRSEIFESDGWRCHICVLWVENRFVFPHPQSPSIDHLIPVSKEGPNTRENIALAHLKCNQKKAARMLGVS